MSITLAIYGVDCANLEHVRHLVASAERRSLAMHLPVSASAQHGAPCSDAVASRWLCEAASRGHHLELDLRHFQRQRIALRWQHRDAVAGRSPGLLQAIRDGRQRLERRGIAATTLVVGDSVLPSAFAPAVTRAGFERWITPTLSHPVDGSPTTTLTSITLGSRNRRFGQRWSVSAIRRHLASQVPTRVIFDADGLRDMQRWNHAENLLDIVAYFAARSAGLVANGEAPAPVKVS